MLAKKKNQVVCWVSSVSYSGTRSDNWGAYPQSRIELGNFFRDSNVTNLFIISGDAHMLAIDNGTHADFSEGKNNPNLYPILQSAALNNVGSDKGGEYSEGGTFPNPPFSSQWTKVEVIDNGYADICIKFTCYRMNLFTKAVKVMTSYEFCRTLEPALAPLTNTKTYLSARLNESGDKILLGLNYQGKATVKLMNYQGKLLLTQTEADINNSYELNVTNLPSGGIYYVIVETQKQNFVSALDLRN